MIRNNKTPVTRYNKFDPETYACQENYDCVICRLERRLKTKNTTNETIQEVKKIKIEPEKRIIPKRAVEEPKYDLKRIKASERIDNNPELKKSTRKKNSKKYKLKKKNRVH